MPVVLEYLKPNILLSIQHPPFVPATDIADMQLEIAKGLEREGYLYIISDLSRVNLTLSEIMQGFMQSTDNQAEGYKAGEEGVEMVIVASSILMRQIAEFYKQEKYSNMNIKIYDTVEKAIAYIEDRENDRLS